MSPKIMSLNHINDNHYSHRTPAKYKKALVGATEANPLVICAICSKHSTPKMSFGFGNERRPYKSPLDLELEQWQQIIPKSHLFWQPQ